MRVAVLAFFCLLWISACAGCGLRPDLDRAIPHRVLAQTLEADTVAIVDEDVDLKCAGVWVGPNAILTAGHCVADAGEPPAYEILRALDDDTPAWNPITQVVRYQIQSDAKGHFWTGRVAKFDAHNDLALIATATPPPSHGFARVSMAEIDDGDRVEVVGHPMGYRWSYAEGYVSSSRSDVENPGGDLMPVLQVDVAFSRGNSGCGAFDKDGNLIGIGSYSGESIRGMGFFVHRNVIRRFLA